MVNLFCILFGTESTILMCGGHEIDCTEVTFHGVAKFRVKHLNSDIERTQGRRGENIISITTYTTDIEIYITLCKQSDHQQAKFYDQINETLTQ